MRECVGCHQMLRRGAYFLHKRRLSIGSLCTLRGPMSDPDSAGLMRFSYSKRSISESVPSLCILYYRCPGCEQSLPKETFYEHRALIVAGEYCCELARTIPIHRTMPRQRCRQSTDWSSARKRRYLKFLRKTSVFWGSFRCRSAFLVLTTTMIISMRMCQDRLRRSGDKGDPEELATNLSIQ